MGDCSQLCPQTQSVQGFSSANSLKQKDCASRTPEVTRNREREIFPFSGVDHYLRHGCSSTAKPAGPSVAINVNMSGRGRGVDLTRPAWMTSGGAVPGAGGNGSKSPSRDRRDRSRSRSRERGDSSRRDDRERGDSAPSNGASRPSGFGGYAMPSSTAAPQPAGIGGIDTKALIAAAMANASSQIAATGGLALGANPATKQARRLYVGNLPHTTAEEVNSFFNAVLSRVYRPGDHLLPFYLNQEKHFGFLEFYDIYLAAACMALDGLTFKGQQIRIRRPNDFTPSMIPPLPPVSYCYRCRSSSDRNARTVMVES
jgi:hypothetical protein